MIVDIHTHIFPPRFIAERRRLVEREPRFAALYADPRAAMATAEDLLDSMAGAGVDRSVAAGFWWADRALAEEHAAYLVEAATASGGAILPFVPLPAADAPAGTVGVGEVREPDPASAVYDGGLPLLVHCSEEVGHAYPGKEGGLVPAALWRLLMERPAARLVAGHWGGGFPFAALMPEVRGALAGRVVFDTAATRYLYTPEVFRRGIDLLGVEAVCWGSDFPLRPQAGDRAEVEAALSDPAERAAVLGGNAARFLGLNTP